MNMPGESGLELARELLTDKNDIAVVMVTGEDDADLAQTAIALGAYGYMIKPFKPNELAINVANALRRRELELESRRYQQSLEETVTRRTQELRDALEELTRAKLHLQRAHEEMIRRLSQAAEFRDPDTGKHIERVSGYASKLARQLGLPPERCELIRLAAPLHDVGKIAVPDAILLKHGELTSGERKHDEGACTARPPHSCWLRRRASRDGGNRCAQNARYFQPLENKAVGGGTKILDAAVQRIERGGDGYQVIPLVGACLHGIWRRRLRPAQQPLEDRPVAEHPTGPVVSGQNGVSDTQTGEVVGRLQPARAATHYNDVVLAYRRRS